MPSLADGPQMELTRDVCNLDDDQLWEALEAFQMEMARREGEAPLQGHPRAIWRSQGNSEASMDDGEVDPRWEGMEIWQPHAVAHKSPLGQCRCQLPP